MFILLAVLLLVLTAVWLVYPLLMRETGASEQERTIIGEEIEREIDELRQSPGTRSRNASEV